MVAALCELLRAVAIRLPVSDKAEAVQILMNLQKFNREMVTGMIDDSNNSETETQSLFYSTENPRLLRDGGLIYPGGFLLSHTLTSAVPST